MSPDPLGGDITNPQSLNRYAYALNNATSFIDPTGLAGEPAGCSVDSLDRPRADMVYVSSDCVCIWDPMICALLPGGGGGPGVGGGGGHGTTGGGSTGGTGGGTSSGTAGGAIPLPPGVNAFLGFHVYCVQTTIGGAVNPASCSLYFLGAKINTFPLAADLSAAGLVIAGSVSGIVPVAYVGGLGPTVQLAFSSQGWGCIGPGGAIGSVGKAFNFGPLTGGDLGNARNVLSGWSVSVGAQSPNPLVGAQAMANSSGWLYGPTGGTPGWSLSGSYSFCGSAP